MLGKRTEEDRGTQRCSDSIRRGMGTVRGERGFGGGVEIGNGDWLDLPCDRYRVVRLAGREGL